LRAWARYGNALLADVVDDGDQALPASAEVRVQAAIDELATDAALARQLAADGAAVWWARASLDEALQCLRQCSPEEAAVARMSQLGLDQGPIRVRSSSRKR
jgi:hypothetical protein